MSVPTDIRSYADTAVAQGKQVLDQAQAQLTEVAGTVNGYVGALGSTARQNVTEIADKATDAVQELRAQAEKAVDLDAVTTAIEPYLAQVKEYSSAVGDKVVSSVGALVTTARKDPRVDKLVVTAESLGAVLVETVAERVVKPVQSLAGVGAKPAASAPATIPTGTTTPAARKPATRPATKAPARKAAAKRTTDS
jgi:ElaB/YqjD/DUF883 family membrane-anchored ribosome-binding protein